MLKAGRLLLRGEGSRNRGQQDLRILLPQGSRRALFDNNKSSLIIDYSSTTLDNMSSLKFTRLTLSLLGLLESPVFQPQKA